MTINDHFRLALTLLISTAIISTPTRTDANSATPIQKVGQPALGLDSIISASSKMQNNSKLNEKIKIIKPNVGSQNDHGVYFGEGPKFSEGKGGFVHTSKDNPRVQRVNPIQKVAPSATQKMKTIGR
jgi:hypothetical protein